MSRSPRSPLRSRLLVSSAWLLAACLPAADAAPQLSFGWKKDDLFRFRYAKTISVRQPDENGAVSARTTEVEAVLILEIKSVTPAAATGTLRFDSPRINLPPIKFYSALAELPDELVDKSRAVARALEGAIKQARWSFTWSADGALCIDARAPAGLHEWLKEVAGASGWRRKLSDQLTRLIEQDLGLRAQDAVDRELLLCFAPCGPTQPASACPLHPLRSVPVVVSRGTDKAQLRFTRLAPAQAAGSLVVPGLVSSRDVQARLQHVAAAEGRAVFDTRLRMLDSLDESYTATLSYACGKEVLKQEVRVEYHLKRLAPPIVETE